MKWVDGVPIIGHVKSLIYWNQGKREWCLEAFKRATHNTGVACLGVLGGYYIGFPGSCLGSIMGGVFVDAALSKWTPNHYGYFVNYHKLINHEMGAFEWFDFLHLVVKDTLTGLFTFYAFNECKVAIQSSNNLESQNETDIKSLMEKKINGIWPSLNSNTITVIPEIVLRGIPIPSLKHYYRSSKGKATNQMLIRIIGLKCFGILGGHIAASTISTDAVIIGSAMGGLFGGLFLDAAISIWNAMRQSGHKDTCVGYMACFGWDMDSSKLMDIPELAANDALDGILTFKPWDICTAAMRRYSKKENTFDVHRLVKDEEIGRDISGIICELEIQKDMSGIICLYECVIQKEIGECGFDACEQPDIEEDDDSSYFTKIWKTRIWNLPEPQKMPVADISELEPGDHLIYRGKIYNHHAIVAEVFPQVGRYIVYEQSPSSNTNESKTMGKARIKEIVKYFEAEELYRVDYGEAGFKKHDVRKNAHFICHHAPDSYFKTKPYNFFFNNCEHFTNFCSMGHRVSYQAQFCWLNILVMQIGLFGGVCLAAINDHIGTSLHRSRLTTVP